MVDPAGVEPASEEVNESLSPHERYTPLNGEAW